MAIETRIPKEIEEYKEKIIFGLSLRQMMFFILAIILSALAYLICVVILKLSMNFSSYVILLIAMPLMAIGFLTKDGQPLDKYLQLVLRHKFGYNKLPYEAKLTVFEETEHDNSIKKHNREPKTSGFEGNTGRAGRTDREAFIYLETKASSKAKRKVTQGKIKTAKAEYRTAKQRAIKEIKIQNTAEKYS